MENRYNLIDEPWIPVADVGRVSLAQLFGSTDYGMLGGTPVQKIAILKFLLSIAQAAATPEDDDGWQAMSPADLAGSCLDYLQRRHEHFYLYGERPILQMPAIHKAECKSYGTVLPEVSTGNTTVLTQSQQESRLDDADKALLLLVQMGFALGGKKTDNSVVLTPGYPGKTNEKGKPSTGKPGPSVGFLGLLHNFVLGDGLRQTLRLNLLTRQDIADCQLYPGGVGHPPWEAMPQGEDCATARQHKLTLQGRLLPLSRFCLLAADGLHYSEGIAHPDYKAGGIDPTIAINQRGKDPKVLWVNPTRRPWRELTALLGFLDAGQGSFDCLQLRVATRRAAHHCDKFAIWSGGLRVSSNAGEQYASGTDDYVESTIWLYSSELGSRWFARLRQELDSLSELSGQLYGCVMGYYKAQLVDGKPLAEQATALYWQLCERDAQQMIESCGDGDANKQGRQQLRRRFAGNLHLAFDRQCPNQTARQLDAWAKSRPNLNKYLYEETR
ncbi:type I-E CRISPR-associated protein Cse1/CasA [Pseudoduganella namucuonensis]|uniref:CRISPR system Cascade subunit CasA n=1 Tax=Pseudoduganella namucuonensis TaxID=1035707 RepID=A0A1I7H7V9_9BURK|nr:type I-E CRISPR-associated protein Cse1/CasA [Pseudoduganella namucuonensis]SFU56770.1 CRISPR system Cascade subunit CasA [Pseudoduganella namucuonensis]